MRIPLRRIYRAFPELDRFSDRECERFIALARKREWLMEIVMGGVAVAALIGVFMVVVVLWRAAPALLPGSVVRYISGSPPLIAVLVTLSALTGPIAALSIRDAWLRRAIQRNIDLATCGECGYSLLGLIAENGRVRCPECGRVIFLVDLGITPEQLMPGAAGGNGGGGVTPA